MVNMYTITWNKKNEHSQRSVKNKHQMRHVSMRLCYLGDKRNMGYGIDRPITLDLFIEHNIINLNE